MAQTYLDETVPEGVQNVTIAPNQDAIAYWSFRAQAEKEQRERERQQAIVQQDRLAQQAAVYAQRQQAQVAPPVVADPAAPAVVTNPAAQASAAPANTTIFGPKGAAMVAKYGGDPANWDSMPALTKRRIAQNMAKDPDFKSLDMAPSKLLEVSLAPVAEGSVFRDVPIGIGKGLLGTIKGLSDLAGATNPLSRALDAGSKGLDSMTSPAAKQARQALEYELERLPQDNITDRAAAYGRYMSNAPALAGAEVAGNVVGSVAGGLGAVTALRGLGAATRVAGAARAGTAVTNAANVGGFAAYGAAAGAGSAKGGIYDRVMSAPIEELKQDKAWSVAMTATGNDEKKARELVAETRQQYSADTALPIAASAGIGALAGATGIPKLLFSKPAAAVVQNTAKKGFVRGTYNVLKGPVAVEVAGELGETTAQNAAANFGAGTGGIPTNLLDGLGEQLLPAAAGGLVGGSGAKVYGGRTAKAAVAEAAQAEAAIKKEVDAAAVEQVKRADAATAAQQAAQKAATEKAQKDSEWWNKPTAETPPPEPAQAPLFGEQDLKTVAPQAEFLQKQQDALDAAILRADANDNSLAQTLQSAQDDLDTRQAAYDKEQQTAATRVPTPAYPSEVPLETRQLADTLSRTLAQRSALNESGARMNPDDRLAVAAWVQEDATLQQEEAALAGRDDLSEAGQLAMQMMAPEGQAVLPGVASLQAMQARMAVADSVVRDRLQLPTSRPAPIFSAERTQQTSAAADADMEALGITTPKRPKTQNIAQRRKQLIAQGKGVTEPTAPIDGFSQPDTPGNPTIIAGGPAAAPDTVVKIPPLDPSKMSAAERKATEDYITFRGFNDGETATALLQDDGTWAVQNGDKTTQYATKEDMLADMEKQNLFQAERGKGTNAKLGSVVSTIEAMPPFMRSLAKAAQKAGLPASLPITISNALLSLRSQLVSQNTGIEMVDRVMGVNPNDANSQTTKFLANKAAMEAELNKPGVGTVEHLYDQTQQVGKLIEQSGVPLTLLSDTYYALEAKSRTAEFAARGATILSRNNQVKTKVSGFEFVDPATGETVPDDDGAQWLARPDVVAAMEKMQPVFDAMQGMERKVLMAERNAQTISNDKFDNLSKPGKSYAPLLTMDGGSPRPAATGKTATGRYTKADDPLFTHIKVLNDRMGRAMRKSVENQFLGVVRENAAATAGLLTPADEYLAHTLITDLPENDPQWYKKHTSFDREMREQGRIVEYENGKAVHVYNVTDPNLKRSLFGNKGDYDAALYVASSVTQTFSALQTRVNPAFHTMAFAWDNITSFLNAQGAGRGRVSDSEAFGLSTSGLGYTYSMAVDVIAKQTTGQTNNIWLKSMDAYGGGIHFSKIQSVEGYKQDALASAAPKPTNVLTKGWNKYQDVMHSGDAAVRTGFFRAYVELKNGGAFASDAAVTAFLEANPAIRNAAVQYSKNITTNFEQAGTNRAMRAWVPFFNPAMQGAFQVLPSILGSRHGRNMSMGVATLALLAAMSASEIDEQGKKKFYRQKKLADVLGSDSAGIPIPPEARIFAAFGIGVAGVLDNQLSVGEAVSLVAEKFVDAVSPFRVTGWDSENYSLWNKLAFAAAGPLPIVAQQITGKNFFGAEVAGATAVDPMTGEALEKRSGKRLDAFHSKTSDPQWAKELAVNVFRATDGGIDMLPNTYAEALRTVTGGMYNYIPKDAESIPTASVRAGTARFTNEYNAFTIRDEYNKARRREETSVFASPLAGAKSTSENLKLMQAADATMKGLRVGAQDLAALKKEMATAQALGNADQIAITKAKMEQLQSKERGVMAEVLRKIPH